MFTNNNFHASVLSFPQISTIKYIITVKLEYSLFRVYLFIVHTANLFNITH
jgi:hypothetical protein